MTPIAHRPYFTLPDHMHREPQPVVLPKPPVKP